MTKGNDPSMHESTDWKKPYSECFSRCELSAARRAALKILILNEPFGTPGAGSPESKAPFLAARAVLAPERRASVLSRVHRSGVGYVAAAAAVFGVFSLTGGRQSPGPVSPVVDSGVLRYARILPADFDLEGDAAALPSVVSEVTGGRGPKEDPFELRVPESLRQGYSPREGRFFTMPSGKLGVAIRMRPERAGTGKARTLYMMPDERDAQDVMPQNNLARYVNLTNTPTRDGRGNTWRSGDVNYMLLDE